MSEFASLTPLAEARSRLLDHVDPIDRTETLALEDADGRVAAETVAAQRAIPHYERVAMDGYAVRAADTTTAGERTPVTLDVADVVVPDAAVAVDTGQAVPAGADAVVPVEATADVANGVRVTASVPDGDNVAPVGEDVAVGEAVVDRNGRIAPAHLGLLRGVGVESVPVHERPTVALVPTGEELVATEPGPGEIVETNSLVVGRYVDRWDGEPERREPVTDDRDALEGALRGASDADLVVTLGGTSVGERDRVPTAVDAVGDLLVHGVGFRPGHPVGVGLAAGTPVLTLPGYPVGCLVAAHLLLRPAVATAGHRPITEPPTTEAVLDRKIASDLGSRTYARVALERGGGGDDGNDDGEDDELPTATPIMAKGSGVLSSVADADGWVVVVENAEGVPADATVAVEHWEGWP